MGSQGGRYTAPRPGYRPYIDRHQLILKAKVIYAIKYLNFCYKNLIFNFNLDYSGRFCVNRLNEWP